MMMMMIMITVVIILPIFASIYLFVSFFIFRMKSFSPFRPLCADVDNQKNEPSS